MKSQRSHSALGAGCEAVVVDHKWVEGLRRKLFDEILPIGDSCTNFKLDVCRCCEAEAEVNENRS